MKFTDKTRISAAIKRKLSGSKNKVQTVTNEENISEKPTKPLLRSDVIPVAGTGKQSKNVLPKICIICGKNKFVCEKHSGKRRQEKLIQCETHTNLIMTAAKQKNDEKLLLHINNIDLVAIEMCYHSSCYKLYTRCLTKKSTMPSSNTSEYTSSFDIFCKETVEKRIIENKEIFRMNKLKDLFIKTVFEVDKIQLTSYKNGNLKRQLRSKYPQLHFIKQSQKNKCEIVLCETDDAGVCRAINLDNSTATDSETDLSDNPQTFSSDSTYLLQILHSSALALKSAIENVTRLPCSWPRLVQI